MWTVFFVELLVYQLEIEIFSYPYWLQKQILTFFLLKKNFTFEYNTKDTKITKKTQRTNQRERKSFRGREIF